jgi:DNA-binding transcriptional ArsR family regulator
MTLLLDTALAYHRAGLVVLPNDPTRKFPAQLRGWQEVKPTEGDIRRWFGGGQQHAIGVRDIEGLDIDNKGTPDAETLYREWSMLVEQVRPGLTDRLLCERTPSGGFHLVWRCSVIAGNQKLATRPPTEEELEASPKLTAVALIETRGKGGQFQVAPSPGYSVVRGDWTRLPEITPEERRILLDCARALSRTDKRVIDLLGRSTGERAGDRFNTEGAGEALNLLEGAGWHIAYEREGVRYLTRPGKDQGISATFGYVAPGVLYVFTTNAAPFQDGRAYGPFAVYAELEHGGDYKKAAKVLYERYEKGQAKEQKRRIDLRTGEIFEGDMPPIGPLPDDWRNKGVTLAELQHRIFPPERWLIEGILPEGACLLAAKYKSKKSWIALALSLAISMDQKALGRLLVSPGRVLYLDLEGKQQRIQKRTRAMLGVHHIAWPDNFHIFTKWPQGDEGMAELEYWFTSYPDTALVVIDVLASFRRPMAKHEEIYRYDRDTVDPLNELFERFHAGGLLVHHFNKGKHDDIMDSITGSTGIPSAVNTMWGLTRDVNDSNITILNMRGRDLENDDPLALRWDTYLNQHVIEGPANEVAISVERKAILKLLGDDEPRTPKEIASALGRPVATVQQLLRKLLNDGAIDKPIYGKYAIVRKPDQTDQTDQSGNSDQGDKSDLDSPTLIAPSRTDQSSVGIQDAVKANSDRSDRYLHGSLDNGVPADYVPSAAAQEMIERLRRREAEKEAGG